MEKMTMKLPPLAVWCGNRQGATVEGLHPHSLTVDQAAEVIRLVEVVHPRLVEALEKATAILEAEFSQQADPSPDDACYVAEQCRAILKEVQS